MQWYDKCVFIIRLLEWEGHVRDFMGVTINASCLYIHVSPLIVMVTFISRLDISFLLQNKQKGFVDKLIKLDYAICNGLWAECSFGLSISLFFKHNIIHVYEHICILYMQAAGWSVITVALHY